MKLKSQKEVSKERSKKAQNKGHGPITISMRHPGKDLKDEQELIRPKEGEGAFQAEGTA